MASYRIDSITRGGESVQINYSIILDKAAYDAAQVALADADTALAKAKDSYDAAQARWDKESGSLPADKVEELRQVVTQAQSAYNKAQTAQGEAKTNAAPDGGSSSVSLPLAEVEHILASGDFASAEQMIFGIVNSQVAAIVEREAALRSAYEQIGKKYVGQIVDVGAPTLMAKNKKK